MRKIVDLHCHYVASEPEATDGFRRLVDQPQMVKVAVSALALGLAHSAEFPFMATFDTTNEELARMVEQVDSPKLVPWCFVDPLRPHPEKEAQYWVERRGMRGIKMYPPMGWYPNDARAMPVYQLAQEKGLPVLLHMGRVAPHPGLRSKYGRPIYLEEVGLECPRLKLIIGHFANMWRYEALHIAAGFPNFFFDLTTSGAMDGEALRQVVEHEVWGLRRIVLGTDGTGADNLERALATLERLAGYGFTEEQLEAVAYDNGMAVLGEKV